MKSKLTVGKLIDILGQYDEESIIKVFDKTHYDLVFIDNIVSKPDEDRAYPDVIFEIKED
jgi:hypothetical protein